MEFKQILSLEVVKNDKTYLLHLPVGAPLGDAYEATWEMLKKIADLINESADKSKMETTLKNGDD